MRWVISSVVFAATVSALLLLGHRSARAVEVLNNGGLDLSTGPYAWTLTQSITGMPGAPISAAEQVDLAQEWVSTQGDTPGLGLFLKPQAGNTGEYDGQNKAVNVSLTQTVNFGAAAAGRTYTFTARSYVQAASSAMLTTLYPDSPSGAVASPTQAYFELAFLNASDTVLGSPATVNLRADPTVDAWRSQFVTSVAPAGTTKIRVRAVANDMVASCTTGCPAGQDIFLDNFTLRDGNVPSLERLAANLPDAATSGYSGNLNSIAAPTAWSVEKTAQDNIQFSSASYARNSVNNPSSQIGMWLRSFAGGDAKILQTLPATAGGNYTFSGWSKWEDFYSGANPSSGTETFMRIEFLDGATTPNVLSTKTLDIDPLCSGGGSECVVQIPDKTWRQFSFSATAPAGTASIRVSAGATGMALGAGNPQSAMFDDFSLTTVVVGVPGDFNSDGKVDAADYVLWRKNNGTNNALANDNGLGTPVGQSHYNLWRANFGQPPGSGNLLESASVPEPSVCCLAMSGLAAGLMVLRRGH